jgi:HAD superfamily hydrolase (TIGR01490 family)
VSQHRSAAFFDLDRTVIAKSSTLAFGRCFYQSGLVNRRAVLKGAYAQFVYLVAGADADQMTRMRDALAELCRGWEAAQVRTVVDEAVHELIDPLVYAEAVELFDAHRREGRDVVIVSSSGEEVVAPIGDLLGADRIIATRMAVVDGLYTGEIDFYAFGPHKADAMRELAEHEGWDLADCFAYSDSATDQPMLDVVGHPTAVNPDKALRQVALERGWPVVDFANPVRLRDRPATPLLAGAALGVAGAALGAAWVARRRVRSSA